ncbi:MAG: ABC transporter ATP-binding protein [bacterium]|jgi:ABC-2 type transport system ATP-binding protein
MADAALCVNGLTKSYGDVRALAGLSFSVAPGEVYGLLGPNGAGKSTAISIIATLLQPDSGEVSVLGRDVRANPAAAKTLLGVIPQDVAIYRELTGRENLAFFGTLYGLSGAKLKSRVDEVLSLVGLADVAGRRAATYSGGMKRRLNIGASLIHEPPLVLLDEPTVGVDPQSRNHIFELVLELKSRGTSFLYTTHYMEEAERLCGRVGIIDGGRIIAEGTIAELIALGPEDDRLEIELRGDGASAESLSLSLNEYSPSFENHLLTMRVRGASGKLPSIIETISRFGAEIASVRVIEPNLEGVFLHLTGKKLREGE